MNSIYIYTVFYNNKNDKNNEQWEVAMTEIV